MSLLSLLKLIVAILVLPYCAGFLLSGRKRNYLFPLLSGYMVEWAVFYAIAIPCIQMRYELTTLYNIYFGTSVALAILGIITAFTKKMFIKDEHLFVDSFNNYEIVYFILFLLLLSYQIYRAIFYAYADGDDAFYIATASLAESSDTMYICDPYRGNGITMNYRYALAPFPMWIACISRFTGMNVAALSHSVLSPFFILLTYVIYVLIAEKLFPGAREKKLLFLLLLEVYVIFANVSTSTAETFLLTRSRQGKASLGNTIIPMIFLMMLEIADAESTKMKLDFVNVLLLTVTSISASLTSMFGNVIYPLMIGFLFIYSFYSKTGWSARVKLILTCLPNLCVVFLYYIWR